MLVDFHFHSTNSDGTCTVEELAAIIAKRDFAAVALTDHDCTGGVERFIAAATVPAFGGVEISVLPGEGFDEFHLLGLGVNPRNAELSALLELLQRRRRQRNLDMHAKFQAIGIPMPLNPRAALDSGDDSPAANELDDALIGRPHYARWLVQHGFASDIQPAFKKYLTSASPAETSCYVEPYRPSAEETFRIVHAAGGVCVMAHPHAWKHSWAGRRGTPKEEIDFALAEREIARLREAGLDGLECFYFNYGEETIRGFLGIANRLGMLVSAGSDFHGQNKINPLGIEVPAERIQPLIERLKR